MYLILIRPGFIIFTEGGGRMVEMKDAYESIRQNLMDAGCDQQTMELCMGFAKEGRLLEMVPELKKHRNHLLDALHKDQKQIDCLDYLLYKIKRKPS